jgi:hypothetical protein
MERLTILVDWNERCCCCVVEWLFQREIFRLTYTLMVVSKRYECSFNSLIA